MPDVIRMFFRARNLILVFFVLIFGIVLLALAAKPKKYEAHMTFLLRNERAEPLVGSDPHQNSIQLPNVTEEDQNSEVELLNSTEVLQQVVTNCHLARSGSAAAVQTATTKVSHDLTVTPVRESSVINVSYISTSQTTAHDVLVQLAKIYLEKRAYLHTATQAGVYFNGQTQSADRELQALSQQRADFMSDHGYGDLPQQIQLELQYTSNLQGQLDGAFTQLDEAKGRLHQIALDQAHTPARIPTQLHREGNPVATQQLTSALLVLRNRRSELLVKFLPNDRTIQEVDREIVDTQSALDGFSALKTQEDVSDANPTSQALDAEANRLNETKLGMMSRAARLDAQLVDEHKKLGQMERDSVLVDDLNRKVSEAQQRADLYEGKALAGRIADNLDAEHISNVVLAMNPTVPAVPLPSPFNFATGLAFSIFASLSIGFISQMISPYVSGPNSIEAAGIPVLAVIPLRQS